MTGSDELERFAERAADPKRLHVERRIVLALVAEVRAWRAFRREGHTTDAARAETDAALREQAKI